MVSRPDPSAMFREFDAALAPVWECKDAWLDECAKATCVAASLQPGVVPPVASIYYIDPKEKEARCARFGFLNPGIEIAQPEVILCMQLAALGEKFGSDGMCVLALFLSMMAEVEDRSTGERFEGIATAGTTIKGMHGHVMFRSGRTSEDVPCNPSETPHKRHAFEEDAEWIRASPYGQFWHAYREAFKAYCTNAGM